MAKRDKNRSYDDWENDWRDEEDSKKQRDKERKNQRVQKYTNAEDWNDVE
jgi:hypothetical protein